MDKTYIIPRCVQQYYFDLMQSLIHRVSSEIYYKRSNYKEVNFMTTIQKSYHVNTNNIKTNPVNKKNEKTPENNKIRKGNINLHKKDSLNQITYSNPISAIKRPLKIDNSNNIFFINHKGNNKTVKIETGDYNLTELRQAIQDKVNESFGIGKVKVDLTGSGSDRLLQAQDSKIYNSKNT